MSTDENKMLVRRLVQEVQNEGRIDVLEEVLAPDFVNHSAPPGVPPTREGVKQVHRMFRSAFPDLQVTIHDQIAEGDTVVTRKTYHGTQLGAFMGLPPSGKQMTVEVIDIFRIADMKITEHWVVGDELGMLQQLGALPAPGQATS